MGLSVRRQQAEALFAAQAGLVVGLGVVGRLRLILGLEQIVWGLGHRE